MFRHPFIHPHTTYTHLTRCAMSRFNMSKCAVGNRWTYLCMSKIRSVLDSCSEKKKLCAGMKLLFPTNWYPNTFTKRTAKKFYIFLNLKSYLKYKFLTICILLQFHKDKCVCERSSKKRKQTNQFSLAKEKGTSNRYTIAVIFDKYKILFKPSTSGKLTCSFNELIVKFKGHQRLWQGSVKTKSYSLNQHNW